MSRIADALAQVGQSGTADHEALGVSAEQWQNLKAGRSAPDLPLLIRVAEATETPLERLLSPYSAATTQWRASVADANTSARARVDYLVEDLSRDIVLLVECKTLATPSSANPPAVRGTHADAELLAEWARRRIGATDKPIADAQDASARLGTYVFFRSDTYFRQDSSDVDAAYLRIVEANCGVAWVAGPNDSPRRRFSVAHELGHHLAGDDFRAEGASDTEGESFANLFAIFFLLPREGARRRYEEALTRFHGSDRNAAIDVSTEYGVSWTACCWHLYNVGCLTYAQRSAFQPHPPTGAELRQIGLRIKTFPERAAPEQVRSAAVRAFQKRKISASKCREIAKDAALTLPPRDVLPGAVVQHRRRAAADLCAGP